MSKPVPLKLYRFPDDYIIKSKRGKEIPSTGTSTRFSHIYDSGHESFTLDEHSLEVMLENCKDSSGYYEVEIEHDSFSISFYKQHQVTQSRYDAYVQRVLDMDKRKIDTARKQIESARKFLHENDIPK